MSDTTKADFINLRLRLSIRRAMLSIGDRRYYREVLPRRFPWATREQVMQVVDEYVREGILTEEKGKQGGSILTWHEEAIK
jgi:hypothetical protein